MDIFVTKTEESWLAAVSQILDFRDESEKPIKITLKHTNKRSISQNNLMWLWYGELTVQIKRKSGEAYSTDDLHEYFKARFCPVKELRFGNKVINTVSTTRLDTGEMTVFLDEIHRWAIGAGFKLTIPIQCEYRELLERQNQ